MGTVFKDVILQTVFTLLEDIGCIHIKLRLFSSYHTLLHSLGWNHHWLLQGNVLQ
jgi:hypothetical protein